MDGTGTLQPIKYVCPQFLVEQYKIAQAQLSFFGMQSHCNYWYSLTISSHFPPRLIVRRFVLK
jgi:hypothetical protein